MWRVRECAALLVVVLLAAVTGNNGQTVPVTCPQMEMTNPLRLLCDPTCEHRLQLPARCERNNQCVCILGYVRQVSGGRCIPLLECPPAGTKAVALGEVFGIPPPLPPQLLSSSNMPRMLRL